MRWKYLWPRLVIVALVWGFFVWAFDPLVRWSVTKTGEQLNGAKVDVAELQTTFFPPSVRLEGVQIADRSRPGKNRAEFQSFRLRLDSGPLMHRKLVIDEGTITGLAWDTDRADSGQLEPQDKTPWGGSLQFDGLRNHVARLGKTWVKEAFGAAKSQLDPKQLETARVSLHLKAQWQARFQTYEARLKNVETRVRGLKERADPQGNTLAKIEAYRQAAVEVQKLLDEARQIRGELSQLAQTAGADFQQIEQAKQRDLQRLQQTLNILKLDKEAISEALLGPELLTALEETLTWVRWTKDNVGGLSAVPEPERSRGVDVVFDRPEDPHPRFLIRRLHVSGQARMGTEPVAFAGTLDNVTSDPKRWGKPMVLDVTADGSSKMHLIATLDRTTDQPAYELTLNYRRPEPTAVAWGDLEQLAFQLSAEETTWDARLKLVGEQLTGRVAFRQDAVRIQPRTTTPAPAQVAAIEPAAFEWNPEREMQNALTGIFAGVSSLEAAVELSGTPADPKWKFSSPLGSQVAEGVERYLSTEIARRRAQMTRELEQMAGEQMASLQTLLNEKFRESAGRLNLTEAQANELVQKFAGRPLDVRGLFRR